MSMNIIQIAQLAWAAKKNKENLDLSMKEMGKSLENIVTAMVNVDPKVTYDMLNDVLKQVKEQSKGATEKLIVEKGEFVDAFLKEHPDEEIEEFEGLSEKEMGEMEKAALKVSKIFGTYDE